MKKVLITGGNKGIGLALTELFLENGYAVAVIARDFTHFSYKEDKRVQCFAHDLTDIEAIPQLVREVGEVDVLINNAGIMFSLPHDEYPSDKKEYILKLNLKAPIALIEAVSRLMVTKGDGRIVNVASIAGEIGHPDIWYGVTKAALINATKSFARLLGPDGIVVNCVAPGPVTDTEMFEVVPQARKEQLQKSTITQTFATPVDVAQTVFWLADSSPSYINGVCIDINNGSFPR
ncbi:MAG TPA: SDR family oxidoreductase [Patescibacteria group bacterium]